MKFLLTICLLMIAVSCSKESRDTNLTKIPKTILEIQSSPAWNHGRIEPRLSANSFATKSVFDEDRNLIYREQCNAGGKVEWREFYKYDAGGNQAEVRYYRFKVKRFTKRRVNSYDSLNNLVASNTYDEYGNKLEMQTVSFGIDGSKAVSTYSPVNGKFVPASLSVFNAQTQNIENRFYSYGNLITAEINYFDESGHLAQRTQFHQERNEEKTILFEYDSLNNTTEAITLNNNSMMESKVTTICDEHQNPVKIFTYGFHGDLREYEHHVYEYNEWGDWTKETTFKNRKPVSVRTRIIEYY
jgi:hypothetical protein